MTNIKLTIKYFDDEIKLYESKCLGPDVCTCKHRKNETQCFMSPDEAKQKFLEYYEHRVKLLKEQTTEDFLNDQGIYI